MNSTIERFIRSGEVSPEQQWESVAWCVAHGGEEFSLRFMRLDGESAPAHTHLREALVRFHRGTAKRGQVTAQVGGKSRSITDLWRCDADSLEILRPYFPDELLAAPSYATNGWLEDFTIFRRGEIMLGVVNHEGIGVLRLTASEHQEFSELKIKTNETA